MDAAFRAGHELLLWDGWAAMSPPGGPTPAQAEVTDRLAALIIAADDGDVRAEDTVIDLLRNDTELAPPRVVTTISPWGDPPRRTDLHRRLVLDR